MMKESAGPRDGREWWLRLVLPATLLVLAVAVPYTLYRWKAPPPTREGVDPRPLVDVRMVKAAPASFEVVAYGTVVPKREVTVAAEVSGRVLRISDECKAGRFVSAGTLLVEIDPARYQLEIQKLASEAKQIDVDLAQHDLERENTERLAAIAEEDLAIAQRELDRVEGLARLNSASASERDQAVSAVMRAKTAFQQLQNSLRTWSQTRDRLLAQKELVETRLRLAKLDLEKTKVSAPIDGIVAEEYVEQSAYVQPGAALCRIEDRQSVEVRCSLKLDDLYWLAGSMANGTAGRAELTESIYRAPRVPATVSYRVAGKTYQWTDAFLARYEGTGVDEKTRTVPCRIEVPNPDKVRSAGEVPTLVRGMFVTVKLLATPRLPLLEIPAAALRPNNEVWVVRDDAIRILRPRVARLLDQRVLLYAEDAGLTPGDLVVTSPLSVAVDGMQVRMASRSAETASAPPAAGGASDEVRGDPPSKEAQADG
jgi:RND family efflux transporter MFP subunit